MNRKGFALMMTLWILVFLAVMAAQFSFSSRMGSAGARNFKEDTLAYYLAVSAYEEALAYLISDKDLDVDYVDEDSLFHTDTERGPLTKPENLHTQGASVSINISDEESRLNINTSDRNTLMRLFELVGVPEESIQVIVDSLDDWKDRDDLHRLLGAEDAYYMGLGYRAKDGFLDVPEELLLVRDFRPEYLYGGTEIEPLYPLLTTWGEGININTVGEEVLEALGFSQTEITTIIQQRSSRGPSDNLPARLAGKGRTSSLNFRIEVLARLYGTPQAVRIISVVNRTMGTDGPELKTLYWKEDIENSGTQL